MLQFSESLPVQWKRLMPRYFFPPYRIYLSYFAAGNVSDIIRTCKDFLDIHMYTVPGSCLTERVSGHGYLCLCRDRISYHPCNTATTRHVSGSLLIGIPVMISIYGFLWATITTMFIHLEKPGTRLLSSFNQSIRLLASQPCCASIH